MSSQRSMSPPMARTRRVPDSVLAPPPLPADPATRPSRIAQAKSYALAQWSVAIEGVVALDGRSQREAACLACPRRKPSDDDTIGYCLACGCGERPETRLSRKAAMPKSTCPLGRWRDERGTGFSARLAARAAIAVVGQTIELAGRAVSGAAEHIEPTRPPKTVAPSKGPA